MSASLTARQNRWKRKDHPRLWAAVLAGARRVVPATTQAVVWAAVLAAMVAGPPPAVRAEVGVGPPALDVVLEAGREADFELTIASTASRVAFALFVADVVQQEDGTLRYTPPVGGAFTPARWVELAVNQIAVEAEEEVQVTGRIRTPLDAAGTYVVGVVAAAQPHAGAFLAAHQAYVVPLYIHVLPVGGAVTDFPAHFRADAPGHVGAAAGTDGTTRGDTDGAGWAGMNARTEGEIPSLPPPVEIRGVSITANDPEGLEVEARVVHHAMWAQPLRAYGLLYDDAGVPVGTVFLDTEASVRDGSRFTRLLPGAEVTWRGRLPSRVSPGTYEVAVFVVDDTGRHVLRLAEATLEEGAPPTSGREVGLEATPSSVALDVAPGGLATIPLEFFSRWGEPGHLLLRGREVETLRERSLFDALHVQSAAAFSVVRPGQVHRVLVSVRAPAEAPPGGYYGLLDGHLLVGGVSAGMVTIPVTIVVAGPTEAQVDQGGVAHGQSPRGEGVWSVHWRNAGSIHFSPWGQLVVYDESGAFLDRVVLSLPEGQRQVLPGQGAFLVGRGVPLRPDRYVVAVEIFLGEQRLAKWVERIEIAPPSP